MRNLILRLGLIRPTLLLTAISIPFSAFLYVLLSGVWGGIIPRDMAVSAIIPSVIGPFLLYFFLRNRTRLDRSETAQRESEEKYKELANSLPQIVFETDENGMITFANQNAFDLFGYSQADLANGLKALNMIVPQDRDRALKNIGNVFNGENLGSVEYVSQRVDGSEFPVMIYANRIRREDKPVGLRGIMIDLTEQKRSEKLLRESEVRFRTALEANPDPVVIYDVEGNVTFFNHAFSEVFGWTLKECTGKKMDMFVPEKNWPETKQMIETVMAEKNVSATETCRYTKDGEILPVVVSGSIYITIKTANRKAASSI